MRVVTSMVLLQYWCNAHVQMTYVDKTLCGDINTVRTLSPLSFWMKDMLSRRERWEIKNDGCGKRVLREGYVDTKVDREQLVEGDRMKNEEQPVKDDKMKNVVDQYGGENKTVTFECRLLISRDYDRAFKGENKMTSLLCRMEKVDSKDKEIMDDKHVMRVNVKIKGGMKVFTRSKKGLTDNSDVLDGVSKDEECDAMRVDGVMKDDEDINLDKIVGEVVKLAETGKGVVKRQTRRKKEVDNTIPSLMLLSQSSQSSPESNLETDVYVSVKDTNEVEMNEPLNGDEKMIWQYLLITIDDK
ncbi:hypothetical protein Hanom_Chr05g00449181 [Helianthus anomalus]